MLVVIDGKVTINGKFYATGPRCFKSTSKQYVAILGKLDPIIIIFIIIIVVVAVIIIPLFIYLFDCYYHYHYNFHLKITRI